MDGIILINKPVGITSFDVVRRAKKIFNTKKIGHTGTLDPFASGLLILCVGKATKLATKLTSEIKSYEGIIKFNKHYDTFDVTGNVLNEDNKIITLSDLNSIKEEFLGNQKQIPPIYSALKVNGKKLYEYARKNIDVEIKPRDIDIYDLNFKETKTSNEFYFDVLVSKGTYIRSLAVDIASKLNTYGALKTLNRTKIANFSLENSVDLENATTNDLISIEEIYKDSKKLVLSDYLIKLVKNGIYLDERQIITNKDFLVYDNNNNLIALYEVVDINKYKPLIIF
ncbi:tRNA pseudouridine(55) synthase TruB [Haploplasma modicum]|uniref:tRNA pseudouridine(55) synthase TruB n=1 Tax=Haploplasma modicum TaxID=2150 RepID=UPI00047B383B|nr:tRNA pseudouridine(55) synthase TruB [Haploplasma modicum]